MDTSQRLFEAVVTAVKPLRQLKVQLTDGRKLDAVISPRMKNADIREGDVVKIELSPYNEQKCRVVA